jgi:lipoprotein-releasing system permease protein
VNFPFFIAKRIHFGSDSKLRVSKPAVRIAMWGIAIGLAVMIITVAIVLGFKQEVRNKVVGFGSHIQITRFDNNSTYEMRPLVISDSMIRVLSKVPGVSQMQKFVTKAGIIKTEDDFQGVVFKGVDRQFDWSFFSRNMVEGAPLSANDTAPSNQVVISKKIADMLHLKLHDGFIAYFIQDRIKAKKFIVSGIYSTNFGQYDKLFILADMRAVQRLNEWQPNQVSGMGIIISDFDQLDSVGERVYAKVANRFDENGAPYYSQTIKDINPQLFAWLGLFDMNVWVILGLMMAVSGFVMISGLLILILERTNMIGILKALGTTNWTVRKIFLYHSCFLIGKGMLWGNLIGLTFCLVQKYTGLIPLDASNYYVSSVPILLNVPTILLLNLGVFVLSTFILVAPSYLITKINPASAIRYE